MGGRLFTDITTPRLRLRPWRDADFAPFAAMNADAPVMEFLPGVLDRFASDAAAQRLRDHFARHGFGKVVVETRGLGGRGGDFLAQARRGIPYRIGRPT
ncbi:MAG TPA: GNAT family N-acetyltransferase [Tepidisphaeraceae bacterium]|nr:GNAT family N-acetyltransferase [Tepidisphaeraceae bacterium]